MNIKREITLTQAIAAVLRSLRARIDLSADRHDRKIAQSLAKATVHMEKALDALARADQLMAEKPRTAAGPTRDDGGTG